MIFTIITIFFIFGTIIGSFLNVVILRYNTQKTFGGRSACMSCKNKLSWYELMPVLSFFALRGRCRSCKTRISIQYPLTEIVAGLIFAGLFWKFKELFFYTSTMSFTATFAYYATVFSLLLVIAVYDIKHKIIPDKLSFVFGLLAFFSLFLFDSSEGFIFSLHTPSLIEFIAGLVISVPFAFIFLISRGTWMGLGDAKLAVGLGLLLGLTGVATATILAFWIGAVVGIFLLIKSKKHGMKTEIPFAPFLVLGSIIAFLCEFNILSIGL